MSSDNNDFLLSDMEMAMRLQQEEEANARQAAAVYGGRGRGRGMYGGHRGVPVPSEFLGGGGGGGPVVVQMGDGLGGMVADLNGLHDPIHGHGNVSGSSGEGDGSVVLSPSGFASLDGSGAPTRGVPPQGLGIRGGPGLGPRGGGGGGGGGDGGVSSRGGGSLWGGGGGGGRGRGRGRGRGGGGGGDSGGGEDGEDDYDHSSSLNSYVSERDGVVAMGSESMGGGGFGGYYMNPSLGFGATSSGYVGGPPPPQTFAAFIAQNRMANGESPTESTGTTYPMGGLSYSNTTGYPYGSFGEPYSSTGPPFGGGNGSGGSGGAMTGDSERGGRMRVVGAYGRTLGGMVAGGEGPFGSSGGSGYRSVIEANGSEPVSMGGFMANPTWTSDSSPPTATEALRSKLERTKSTGVTLFGGGSAGECRSTSALSLEDQAARGAFVQELVLASLVRRSSRR